MTTTQDRLMALERRVNDLQTYAGPGQAAALADGLKELRDGLAAFRRDMAGFQRQMARFQQQTARFQQQTARFQQQTATFQQQTATFQRQTEQDLGELTTGMAEVLRRLPPPPAA